MKFSSQPSQAENTVSATNSPLNETRNQDHRGRNLPMLRFYRAEPKSARPVRPSE
jgi:hypothetical protein